MIKRWVFTVLAACIASAWGTVSLAAMPAIETKAKQAVVVDVETDTVLLSKDAFTPMYPASMTKIMTAHILFDHLKEGRLSPDDTFSVSEKAWRKGGSKMFVKVNTDVTVSDLLRGIIVQSGNDACIVVAEGISGTEEQFAELMNRKAKEMGMENTHFKNSTGWPDDEHVMSPHDLYLLANNTITNHPEYYPIYSEKSFTYSGITQPNRNLLLGENGVDGLKTGHTEAAGYGITISGVNEADGRRIIVVVNGLGSERERADEAEKLLQWAYRNFENKTLWQAGEKVATANVWFGTEREVPLVTAQTIRLNLPKGAKDSVELTATFMEPLPAPLEAGQEVGQLNVQVPGRELQSYPLLAGGGVEKLSGAARIAPALRYYIFGTP